MQNGWTFHVIWCSGVRQAGSWTTLQQWFFCFGWPVWGTPSLDWGRFTSRLHCLIRHQLGLAVLLAKGYRAEWTCWTSSWNHFINQLKLEHCLSLHKFSNWIGRRVLWQWQVGALCGKANAAEPFAKCFAEPLPRHLQRSHLSSQKGELLFECGSTVWDMWIEWKWFEMIRIGSKWWMERLIRTDSNWEKWIWSRPWPSAKVMGLLGRCDEPSQGNSSSERSRKNRWRLGETAGLRFPQILNRWYVWNYVIIWPLWLITWLRKPAEGLGWV